MIVESTSASSMVSPCAPGMAFAYWSSPWLWRRSHRRHSHRKCRFDRSVGTRKMIDLFYFARNNRFFQSARFAPGCTVQIHSAQGGLRSICSLNLGRSHASMTFCME